MNSSGFKDSQDTQLAAYENFNTSSSPTAEQYKY